jgi:hypothetical protein
LLGIFKPHRSPVHGGRYATESKSYDAILAYAAPSGIHLRQVELCIAVVLRSGKPKPLHSLFVIPYPVFAAVKRPQQGLGIYMALFRSKS